MANQATTTYKVTGTRKAVSDLWNTLQKMNVNTKNIWLDDLAKYYGIDYEAKHISVRGHISQYFSHFLSISHYCAPNFKCRVMEYYYHFSVFLTKCPELHFLL